jgi:hypothetical protein
MGEWVNGRVGESVNIYEEKPVIPAKAGIQSFEIIG